MNIFKKIAVTCITLLVAFAGFAEWGDGEQTIGKVTFGYYYGDDYCSIQHLTFDDGFNGVLNVPEKLGGHTVTDFYPHEDYEGEYDDVTSIRFPAGIQWISSYCVRDFAKLESVTVDSAKSNYKSIGGVLYEAYSYTSDGKSRTFMSLAIYPHGKKDAVYEVPEGVTSFFAYCDSKWVDEYDGNYWIGQHEEKIPVNEYLTTIKFAAPADDDGYLSVNFYDDPFPNLTTAYVPAALPKHAYINIPGVKTLHVTGSGELSDSFSNCRTPDVQTVIFDGAVTEIPAKAFENNQTLEKVVLPTGLVRIGAKAFLGCENLTDMAVPSTVKHVGKFAFAGCPAVASDGEDFAAALDIQDVAVTTSGDGGWELDFDESIAGEASMCSGYTYHDDCADLSVTVPASGEMTFWWKVSSEEGCDELKLLVNGVEKMAISGEVDWSRESVAVGEGDVVTWRYEKDGNDYDGADMGWVDLVKIPNAPIETDVADTVAQFANGRYFDKNEWTRILSRLDDEVSASPNDKKLRIYRALAKLMDAVTDQRLRDLFETCGYELNVGDFFRFDDVKAQDIFSFDNLPRTDAAVDTLATVLVPALYGAEEDLDTIPENWSGTVALDASIIPLLSETVYVDNGDVLLAKAAIEAALGTINYAQAQRLNVDYDKLPFTCENKWTKDFENLGISCDESRIPWTAESKDGRNVIRTVRDAGIEISGNDKDWAGIAAAANAGAHQTVFADMGDGWVYPTQSQDVKLDWFKAIWDGEALCVALKASAFKLQEGDNIAFTIADDERRFIITASVGETVKGVSEGCLESAWMVFPKAMESEDFEPDCFELVMKSGFVELRIAACELEGISSEAEITVSANSETTSGYSTLNAWARPAHLELSAKQLLCDHPEFLSAIRNSAKLTSSKTHVAEAMRLALAADAAIDARSDSVMHFFEYDPDDADKRDTVRSYAKQAQASIKSAQTFDFTDSHFGEKVKIYGGGLFDTKGLTRALLPTVTDDNKIVLSSASDYTLRGILPGANLATWQRWIKTAKLEDVLSDGSNDDDDGDDPYVDIDIPFDEESGSFAELRVGKYVNMPMSVTVDGTAVKLSVSGLPAGLKYDAKSGIVSGTVTKEGTSTVKVSYKVNDQAKTLSYSVTVKGMPTGAVGSFNGVAYIDVSGSGNTVPCLFAATVSSKGAISGAITAMGKKASFKASGYTDCDEESDALVFGGLSLDLKSAGLGKLPFSLWIGDGCVEGWSETSEESVEIGPSINSIVGYQDRSKDKAFLASASGFAGTYLTAFQTEIDGTGDYCAIVCALVVDAKGKAKATGTFADGGTFSGSGYLTVFDEEDYANVLLVVTPKTLGQGGLELNICIPRNRADTDLWAYGEAAKYTKAGGYAAYALDCAFAYPYSASAWVDPNLNPNATYLAIDYGSGKALYELAVKNGIVTGIGKTMNGSKLSLKFDNKTGIFSGSGTVDGQKLAVFGAFDEGMAGKGIRGLGTAIWADGIVTELGIGAEELDVEECFDNESWNASDCPIYVGQSVFFEPAVYVNGEPVTLKVSGLPSGMKYGLTDCCSEEPVYAIYGAATKTGNFSVKVEYAIGTKKVSQTLAMYIAAMPDGVAGTYTGYVSTECFGFFPMTATVKNTGALDGTITAAGKKVKFSAAGFNESWYDEEHYAQCFAFYATADFKAALGISDKVSLYMTVSDGMMNVEIESPYEEPWYGTAQIDRSKMASYKSSVSKFACARNLQVYTEDGEGTLTLKVDSKGKITASGKVGKMTIKGSGTLNFASELVDCPYCGDYDQAYADLFLSFSALGSGSCYWPIFIESDGTLYDDGVYATGIDKKTLEPYDYDIQIECLEP